MTSPDENRCPLNDDPRKIATQEEAFSLYEELRKCPVHHSDAQGGFYWLTRYEDVRTAALESERFSSGRKGVMLPPSKSSTRLPAIEMDPPKHSPWRRLYMEALTPQRLKAVQPQLTDIVNGLIDTFAGAGECDLMKDFADPLPVLGVCATIGVSGLSVDRIRSLSRQFVEGKSRQDVLQELGGLVVKEVLERRATPRDDYLTLVAQAEFDGRVMDKAELALFMSGFLIAGHETTTSSLGTLLAYALSQPALKERMLTDDRVIMGAVEEAVRLHPPFHAFHRTTTAPVDFAGVTVPDDATVRLCYASANRDPEVYERPDAFDPDRHANRHMGFGFGRHVCVGAPLARLEMRIAFKELLRRLPDIQLADPAVEWKLIGGTVSAPKPYRATFSPVSVAEV